MVPSDDPSPFTFTICPMFGGKLFYKHYEYEDIFAATHLDPQIMYISVADPRYLQGGDAKTRERAPTYHFVKFSQKMDEIERIWIRLGGGEGSMSKILLCRSATAYFPFFSSWAWNMSDK